MTKWICAGSAAALHAISHAAISAWPSLRYPNTLLPTPSPSGRRTWWLFLLRSPPGYRGCSVMRLARKSERAAATFANPRTGVQARRCEPDARSPLDSLAVDLPGLACPQGLQAMALPKITSTAGLRCPRPAAEAAPFRLGHARWSCRKRLAVFALGIVPDQQRPAPTLPWLRPLVARGATTDRRSSTCRPSVALGRKSGQRYSRLATR